MRPVPLQSLNVGMRLWGAISEISAHQLAISLPHGLRGHVHVSEASDVLHGLDAQSRPDLATLFQIGQLVRCTVISMGGDDDDAGGKTPYRG